MDDVLINKAATIERCLARIVEELDGDSKSLANITKQDSIILNLQRACRVTPAVDTPPSLDDRAGAMTSGRFEMRGLASAPGLLGGGSNPAAPTPKACDVYFSADVETDGPIPGIFSMLSFALVYAGRFDGTTFERPETYGETFEANLRPISDRFEAEALEVNRLDRERLQLEGREPSAAMGEAAEWVRSRSAGGSPVLVAYPLSFDWSWLYWYFIRFSGGSPFNHSRCFDLKTAIAVRGRRTVLESGHDKLPSALKSELPHTHRALDDAIEQADMLAKFFAWDGT